MSRRCEWCEGDELYQRYHDEEWGMPVYDDRSLFECLNLEGAQAGLSWITILKKRESYREAFDGFDTLKMARYSDKRVEKLLNNPGIVRNRLKVNAFINNARLYNELQKTESFSEFLWSHVNHKPIQNRWKALAEVPASTPESDAMSKALKKRGFKFTGSTICYAFMQACGMVNDHVVGCPARMRCKRAAAQG